ncbi:MAG: DUF58 domain-containing protein [Pseudomonadota bacterium]
MRPATRLMWLAIGAFALSLYGIASETLPAETGLWLFAALGFWLAYDLLVSQARGGWQVGLEGPGEIFAGEADEFVLWLTSAGGVPDRVSARLEWPRGLDGPEEVWFEPADGGAVALMKIRARRRGAWRIERMWLGWDSRYGLVQFCPKLPLNAEIAAVPNIRQVQSGQIDVTVRSTLFGVKENMLKGEGSEFHQLREYVTGMDPRTIDWKQSARHRALVAKEMRAERNHHVILALDNGFLMREEIGEGSNALPKIDHAVNAALATAWAAGLGGDLVGMYAFDSQPRMFLPPEPGRAGFAKLRARTAELAYESRETNHTLAMAHLHQRLKRRSLVVVFSDFVDTTTAELLVENITVLNKAHVMVFVALRDPGLEAIANAPPDGMTDVARAVSAAQMIRERRVVMERLVRMGVFVVDTLPEAATSQLISTYLTIKSRELI